MRAFGGSVVDGRKPAAAVSARDRRRFPARPDVAAEHLRGLVEAERFTVGRAMRVYIEVADIVSEPRASAPRDTQGLYGENVQVFDIHDGWAWAQLANDEYVGYVAVAALRDRGGDATHCVRAPRTFVYASASIKAGLVAALPMGAALRCVGVRGSFLETEEGGFVFAAHLDEAGAHDADFVAVAERFLHAPYLWGGKSWLGLDCSGLIQVALRRAGISAPRDTDMLEAELGARVELDPTALRRGDLVFWKGHVGVMQDKDRLLHANGHHMLVASEPLDEVRSRVSAAGGGEVTSVRRL